MELSTTRKVFLFFFLNPTFISNTKMFNPPPFFFFNKKHPLTYTGYDCIMSFMGRQFSYYIDYLCDYYHKETNFFFLSRVPIIKFSIPRNEFIMSKSISNLIFLFMKQCNLIALFAIWYLGKEVPHQKLKGPLKHSMTLFILFKESVNYFKLVVCQWLLFFVKYFRMF